jgi:hypothetical protein
MEKINYFPATLSSWAADNVTFYDAAGKALAEKPLFMRTASESRTPAQQKLFDRVGGKLKAPSSFSGMRSTFYRADPPGHEPNGQTRIGRIRGPRHAGTVRAQLGHRMGTKAKRQPIGWRLLAV